MARIDLSEVDPDKPRGRRELPPIGCYPCVSTGATERTSKKGHALLNVKWEIVAGPHAGTWFFDIIMLAGPGAGMGVGKINAIIGEERGDGDEISELDFLDRRNWVYVKHDTYDGKTRLAVDIKGGKLGYEPMSKHPWPTVEKSAQPEDRNTKGATDDGAPYDFEDLPF